MGAHLRSHLREQVRVRILAMNGEVARCVIGRGDDYGQHQLEARALIDLLRAPVPLAKTEAQKFQALDDAAAPQAGKPRRYCQACLHSPHDSPCAEMVDRQDNGDRPCGCEWAAGPAKAETPRTPATTPTKETP